MVRATPADKTKTSYLNLCRTFPKGGGRNVKPFSGREAKRVGRAKILRLLAFDRPAARGESMVKKPRVSFEIITVNNLAAF